LVDALTSDAALVPMDGIHLSKATLTALSLLDRKGAPETFDAAGHVALLHRLRNPDDQR
jgi:pantothenate kinase